MQIHQIVHFYVSHLEQVDLIKEKKNVNSEKRVGLRLQSYADESISARQHAQSIQSQARIAEKAKFSLSGCLGFIY
jgi:hypothetical protein